MAESSAHEPTMEEILASIRRIISEDDAPEATEEKKAAPAVQAPEVIEEPEPEPFVAAAEPEFMEEPVEDVLELTEIESKPASQLGDLDIYEIPAPVKPLKVEPAPIQTRASGDGSARAAQAFGALTNALAMPKAGRTIEDFLTELVQPMVQSWLDENLPRIVEEQVRIEVERVSRQARYNG